MKKLFLLIFLIFFAASIQAEANPTSSVKKLIGFIRYKKTDSALAMIDTKTYSRNLLKNNYDSLSADQQKELEEAVKGYLKAKSFPLALNYFSKIDINYEKPVISGKEAKVPSSILYKGSEKIQFSWVLQEKNGQYLITDFLNDGKLASDTYRTTQVEPVFKSKGFEGLVEAIKKASK